MCAAPGGKSVNAAISVGTDGKVIFKGCIRL